MVLLLHSLPNVKHSLDKTTSRPIQFEMFCQKATITLEIITPFVGFAQIFPAMI